MDLTTFLTDFSLPKINGGELWSFDLGAFKPDYELRLSNGNGNGKEKDRAKRKEKR